ncbi:MAG TPA: hypothetical protein ENH32_05275 [Proteobacteria bacterium]|nr:hypothetical protein [Pseudomonadota bacterium]
MNPKFAQSEGKPAVYIYGTGLSDSSMVEKILLGLEEEGVPAEIFEGKQGSPESMAKQAADRSPVSVGVGVDGRKGVAVLHHRDLPEKTPLFIFGPGPLEKTSLRNLGANAARLVKGNPMILAHGSDGESNAFSPIKYSQEQLEQLVREAIAKIELER